MIKRRQSSLNCDTTFILKKQMVKTVKISVPYLSSKKDLLGFFCPKIFSEYEKSFVSKFVSVHLCLYILTSIYTTFRFEIPLDFVTIV